MILLSIAVLIIVVVFIAVPELQSSVRDNHRKAYARAVFQSVQEYYKNNARYPACSSAAADPGITPAALCSANGGEAAAIKFLTNYMPDGKDPLTGKSYVHGSIAPYGFYTPGPSSGIGTSDGSAVYLYDMGNLYHNIIPVAGQIYLAAGHWCLSTSDDGFGGPVLSGPDIQLDVYSVVIGLERGGFYCLDNKLAR
jgi:hypothetical protein